MTNNNEKAISDFQIWQEATWKKIESDLTKELKKQVCNGNIAYVKELTKRHKKWYSSLVLKPNINDGALAYAIKLQHIEIIDILLEKGSNVDKPSRAPLFVAAEIGDLNTFKRLQEKSARFKDMKEELLSNAVQNNSYDVAEHLIESGANPKGGHNKNLLESIKNNNKEIIELLLRNGSDINTSGSMIGSPLQYAAGRGQKEMVSFLLKKGADIHTNNDCALILAASKGHVEIVDFLLDKGANIHARTEEALWMAAENGHREVVDLLIERGANIDDAIIQADKESTKKYLQDVKHQINGGWHLLGAPEDKKIMKIEHNAKAKTTMSTIFNLKSEKVVTQIERDNKVSQSSEKFSDYNIPTEIDEAKAEYTKQVSQAVKKNSISAP